MYGFSFPMLPLFSQLSNRSRARARWQLRAQIKHFLLNVIMCVITEMATQLRFPVASEARSVLYAIRRESTMVMLHLCHEEGRMMNFPQHFHRAFQDLCPVLINFALFVLRDQVSNTFCAVRTGRDSLESHHHETRTSEVRKPRCVCAKRHFELVWFYFHHKPTVSDSPVASLQKSRLLKLQNQRNYPCLMNWFPFQDSPQLLIKNI